MSLTSSHNRTEQEPETVQHGSQTPRGEHASELSKRLRILYVTRELPNSGGAGVERRAAQNLSALRTLGNVTVVMPHHTQTKLDRFDDLRVPNVERVVIREEQTLSEARLSERRGARGKWQWLRQSLRLVPYHLDLASPEDAARYRANLGSNFDVIFCFRLSSAVWVDSVYPDGGHKDGSKKVVDLDDIESVSFRNGNIEPRPSHILGAIRFLSHAATISKLERRIARTWGGVSLCSELDVARFKRMTGRSASVIPNSTPFDGWSEEVQGHRCNILFVGSFPYRPNYEGVMWFIKEVWPIIQRKYPERFSLTLAGFSPPVEIRILDSQESIQVLDSPPDLGPIYHKANIVIVPIFSGSGTRIKVIEAIAKNRVVVSTTIGCEGLELIDKTHYCDANDAESFVAALASLADDPERRVVQARAAFAYARDKFSQEEVNRRVAGLIGADVF